MWKRGQKVICKDLLLRGQIGRVIEDYGDICLCAFGEFTLHIKKEELEIFDNEFIERS